MCILRLYQSDPYFKWYEVKPSIVSSKLSAEPRTTLDNNLDRDDLRRKIVRPPANLLVFEGDGVDSEASELDSYLVILYSFACNWD